jgi:hypothetical protein
MRPTPTVALPLAFFSPHPGLAGWLAGLRRTWFHSPGYFYFRPFSRRFSGNGICALVADTSKRPLALQDTQRNGA